MEVEECNHTTTGTWKQVGDGIEVLDVISFQLKKHDKEALWEKILSEEDPTSNPFDIQAEQQQSISGTTQLSSTQFSQQFNTQQTSISSQQTADNINKDIKMSFKYVQGVLPQTTQNFNSSNTPQTYPALITVDTHRSSNMKKLIRTPIDLVCIVDNSGSMSSENKMKLVRKSLRYLLKVLTQHDRLAIITFSMHAKIRCGFLRNSVENKVKFKEIIKKIQPASSTNIADGMEDCLKLLNTRQYRNPVTTVFLLSDGKDDKPGVVERVRSSMQQYQGEQFELNTFGYGSDHDPRELSGISALRNGNFFYVTELKLISKYFILALGALLNAVADNITISFNLQDFRISKAYGADGVWKQQTLEQEKESYEVVQPHLIEGDLKQYVCELVRKDTNGSQNCSSLRNVAVLEGRIIQQNSTNGNNQVLRVEADLQQAMSEGEISEIVVNHLRAKGGEVIASARVHASLDRFEIAQNELSEFLQELSQCAYRNDVVFSSLKSDLEQAQRLCQKTDFQLEGQAFMIKKERNYLKRSGSISSGAGWTEAQAEIMQDFNDGQLALSDDSCPSRYEEDVEEDFAGLEGETEGGESNKDKENSSQRNEENICQQMEVEEQDNQMNQGKERNQAVDGEDKEEDEKDDEDIEKQDDDDDEEEEEEIALSSLAQKLLSKHADIDKINKMRS